MHHLSSAMDLFCRECARLCLYISKIMHDFWYHVLAYQVNHLLQALKVLPQ